MRTLKTKKADLESKRFIFLQVGFIVALGLALTAFEWTSVRTISNLNYVRADNSLEEIALITKHKEPPKPEPKPKVVTMLNIVDNTVETIDEIIINIEDDQKKEAHTYEFKLEEDDQGSDEIEIFKVVETAPEFPGGLSAMHRFLRDNIVYPQVAREAGISGTVYVTFVVSPSGKITDIGLLRGIGGGCDEEAMRVVKNMPLWKPGKQRGKAVYVQFNLPIAYKLN